MGKLFADLKIADSNFLPSNPFKYVHFFLDHDVSNNIEFDLLFSPLVLNLKVTTKNIKVNRKSMNFLVSFGSCL